MKKFKTKRQRKLERKNILLIGFCILFIIIFIYLSTRKLEKDYNGFINYVLEEQGFVEKENSSFFSVYTSNLEVLLSNYYFKDAESEKLVYQDNDPLVYIYATHDEEEYKNDKAFLGLNNDIYSVINVLSDELAKYNIKSVNEEKRVSTFLDKENLNYSNSYKISRRFLEEVVILYPTLNYFIDIHRDSVGEDITTTTINNKVYAKILFVLGLENKNYKENKVLITKLNDYLNSHYKGISRGIYEKKGSGVNGVYNQDFHPNTILIEIGGVDNNMESVVNSTEIIAEALYYIIGDENEKGN